MTVITVDEYLARLPNGIDSYPEAVVKGSVVSQWLRGLEDVDEVASLLPPEAGALLRHPPPASFWSSEVAFNAIGVAVYQVSYAGKGGMPAWDAWMYAQNKELLGGPLYRILFAVLSPERLAVGVRNRWSAFRRGSSLEVVQGGTRSLGLRLVAPPYLVEDLARRAFCAAFRVAMELGGAKLVRVGFTEESPTATYFDVRWG